MLRKPDERQLKALRNLQNNEDWRLIMQWFEDSLQDIRESSDRKSDEVQLRWNQGGAQSLSDLLENAKDPVGKLKARFK